MNEKKLKQILEQHKLWFDTGGVKGQYAKLQYADFRGVNLMHMCLYDTSLRGADLQNTNFYGADLRGAKFDHGILKCYTLSHTKWLKTDIPWYIQHPDYSKWADTIQILDVCEL